MNAPKCAELDYIQFLIAAQKVFSNTEAARSHLAVDRAGPHAPNAHLDGERVPEVSTFGDLPARAMRCVRGIDRGGSRGSRRRVAWGLL